MRNERVIDVAGAFGKPGVVLGLKRPRDGAVQRMRRGVCVASLDVVILDDAAGELHAPISASWWMGRRLGGSRVGCVVSAWGPTLPDGSNLYATGAGWASGYGYCRQSGALAAAMELSADAPGLGGAGWGAIRESLAGLALWLGWARSRCQLLEHSW